MLAAAERRDGAARRVALARERRGDGPELDVPGRRAVRVRRDAVDRPVPAQDEVAELAVSGCEELERRALERADVSSFARSTYAPSDV